jgi:hypothetical protein
MLNSVIFLPVTAPVSFVRVVETNDSLAKNFKMKFKNFRSHPAIVNIFEDAFSFEVSNSP